MSGYVGLNQLRKQKPEAAGSRGAVQALRMENDAHVVGPDAPIANSKMKNWTCDRVLESANFWFVRLWAASAESSFQVPTRRSC